jgi:thiol:disulfide interchange protein
VTRSLSGVSLLFNRLDTIFFPCPSYWMRVLRYCFGLLVLGCWTLEGTLSVWSSPRVKCFELVFLSLLVLSCFLAGSSSELWKWHRKLGHLSFDLLSCLSKLNLVQRLPRLWFEKELVCAPCRHAKMVASSHLPLIDVMTQHMNAAPYGPCWPNSCAICG